VVLLSCNLADCRRQYYSDRLKDLAAVSLALGPNGEAFFIFFDGDRLQGSKIPLDVGPLEYMTGMVQAPLQFFSQDQGQKAAEHVAPDVLVALVVFGKTPLADGANQMLLDFSFDFAVFDDLQVLVFSGFFDACEHGDAFFETPPI